MDVDDVDVNVDDLLEMTGDDLVTYLETRLGQDFYSDMGIEPEFVRQVLHGEGGQEFKSLLISNLFPNGRETHHTDIKIIIKSPSPSISSHNSSSTKGEPINTSLLSSSSEIIQQQQQQEVNDKKHLPSQPLEDRNNNHWPTISEFDGYRKKFNLKPCTVVLQDIKNMNSIDILFNTINFSQHSNNDDGKFLFEKVKQEIDPSINNDEDDHVMSESDHVNFSTEFKNNSDYSPTDSEEEELSDYEEEIKGKRNLRIRKVLSKRSRKIKNNKNSGVSKCSGSKKQNWRLLWCQLCEIKFEEMENMMAHEETHSTERPFKCSHCFKRFERIDHCREHEKTHFPPTFRCSFPDCGQSFYRHYQMRAHQREHEQSTPTSRIKKPKRNDVDQRKIHICPVSSCQNKFTTIASLRNHLKSFHPTHLPFACTFSDCSSKFSLEHYVSLHTSRVHRVSRLLLDPEQGYPCTFAGCAKVYTTRKMLIIHFRTHAGDYRYCCRFKKCGKKFVDKPRLTQHMRTHSTEQRYLCDQCEYRSQWSTNVRLHKERVHGVKHEVTKLSRRKITLGETFRLRIAANNDDSSASSSSSKNWTENALTSDDVSYPNRKLRYGLRKMKHISGQQQQASTNLDGEDGKKFRTEIFSQANRTMEPSQPIIADIVKEEPEEENPLINCQVMSKHFLNGVTTKSEPFQNYDDGAHELEAVSNIVVKREETE